jgi:hypothetical protein
MPRRAPWWVSIALALLILSTLALVSCGEEEGTPTNRPQTASEPPSVPIAESPSGADKAMAVDVQRYFRRNAAAAPWYSEIQLIAVTDGVVRIDTTLNLAQPQGRKVAAEICNLIQGSDVADFTPGHTVRGGHGERVTCPHREE